MVLIIKNIRAVSLIDELDTLCDILCEDGKISCIGKVDSERYPGAKVIDGTGLCASAGLVDLFARAYEPAPEGFENLATMAQAAANGGFTTVCTHTGAKTRAQLEEIAGRSTYAACDLLPAICATDNGELLNYGELILFGAVAIYDSEPVENPLTMRNAMFRARKYNLPLLSRCADKRLYGDAVMRESVLSRVLDTVSVPRSAEVVAVARDIVLSAETGTSVHLSHISTAPSVDVIRRAKAEGIKVTCSTAPHYFSLSCSHVAGYNTMAKVEPPLGEKSDMEAIIQGLSDGTIDCIATGHTPVVHGLKARSMAAAEYGISSLETALGICLTYLYHSGSMGLAEVMHTLSWKPSQVLGLKCGRLRVGEDADIVVFDPDYKWKVNGGEFLSLGKNTPFEGASLTGKPIYTIKAGRLVTR